MNNRDYEPISLMFGLRELDEKAFGSERHFLVFSLPLGGQKYTMIDKSEPLKMSKSVDIIKSFDMNFIFESKQRIRIALVPITGDINGNGVASFEFELSQIAGSLENMRVFLIIDKNGSSVGKAAVYMEKALEVTSELLTFCVKVKGIPTSCFSSQTCYVWMSKLRTSFHRVKEAVANRQTIEPVFSDIWLPVAMTAVLSGRNINYPPIMVKSSALCLSQPEVPFRVELWRQKNGKPDMMIGETFFKLSDLENSEFTKPFQMDGVSGHTTVSITCISRVQQFSFLDYIQAGLNIGLVVGVDFTASNEEAHKPNSLHHISPGLLNCYQRAILGVGEVLQRYDHDGLIPAYGFGAIIPGDPGTSHFFPLSMDTVSPYVQGLANLLGMYEHAVKTVTLSGPTHFAPMLEQVNSFTSSRLTDGPFNYTVLLILTDGAIMDMQKTIDQIVIGSILPLSIVIVGIGNGDFSSMDYLDGDKKVLRSSSGVLAARDIVQFVPFSVFANNPIALREEVLAELPAQVTSYFVLKGLAPPSRKPLNPKQISESILNKELEPVLQPTLLPDLEKLFPSSSK